MTTLGELEAIRARHEAAESDGRYDLSWHEDYGQAAHRDRATLLRLLDAAREELREVREAAQEYFTGYMQDEAADDGPEMTGCSLDQHDAAKRLAAALTRAQGES
jgi:hypothetical protein